MKVITFSPKSIISARNLKNRLQELLGVKILLSNKQGPNRDIIVNYGSGERWVRCENNSPEFVSLCCGKYSFSNLLQEAGFHVPVFRRGRPTEYPALVRETLTGFGGVGIHTAVDEAEYNSLRLSSNYWWTPYIHTKSEFRVHILGGEIAKVSKKVFRSEDEDAEEGQLPIRSHSNGYFFKLIENEWKKWDKLLELVHKLSTVLTGSFYGLDVGYSTELHDYFIFEANSAPGLNEQTLEIYAQYLTSILGGAERGGLHRAETNSQRSTFTGT